MNLFGEMGNFIIEYQEFIQTAAIILGIVAAVVIIIKLVRHEKKKATLLTQINDSVSEINTAVNHLQEKKADVIYIDSRMSASGENVNLRDPLKDMEETAVVKAASDEDTETEAASEDIAATEAEKEAAPVGEKIEPSLKYFSRDCAVSKTGKKFTYEELDAQIKE